jgi:hypothetical protein
MGSPLRRRRCRCFYVGATFVAPQSSMSISAPSRRPCPGLQPLCHTTFNKHLISTGHHVVFPKIKSRERVHNGRPNVLSPSLFPLLLFPLWSIGHPWNALFRFSFLILRQLVGLLGRGISPSQGRYLYKHRINADIHPCLEWDSKPRSQCSSERRQFRCHLL